MIYRLLLAALCVVCFAMNAEARQRHKTYVAFPECNVTMPCEGVSPSPRGEYIAKSGFGTAQKVYKPRASSAKSQDYFSGSLQAAEKRNSRNALRGALKSEPSTYLTPSLFGREGVGRPGRYIAGRLICAVNVGSALAERGIKGTGSALALSYLHWGRSAGGPVPGAVIVSARRGGGGHVAIVSRVEGGVVYAWNATGGQSGWREIPYRHRVLDYRVPG